MVDIRLFSVVFSNDIARAYRGPRLTPTQWKFIAVLMARIRNARFDEFQFSINTFLRIMGVTRSKEEAIEEINRIPDIRFHLGADPTEYVWLEYVREEDGNFFAKLHHSLEVILLNLKDRFVLFQLGFLCNLKKTYSIQLYILLHSWLGLHHTNPLSVDNLRALLGLEKYERPADLERRILDPAIKEINEGTNITVSYKRNECRTPYSQRKCVGSYTFIINEKSEEETKKLLLHAGIHEEQINSFDRFGGRYCGRKQPKKDEELLVLQRVSEAKPESERKQEQEPVPVPVSVPESKPKYDLERIMTMPFSSFLDEE